MEGRGDIAALTGLRFVAAATIALSHFALSSGFAVFGVPLNISSIGMPLFFTLSGFIVHYVYAGSFARGWRSAVPKFGIARFSRLYPLFFAMLLFHSLGRLGRTFMEYPGLGLSYATLTASWWYWIIDGRTISTERYGISWSISTEVFFYLVYALGLYRIDGLQSARVCLIALGGLCIFAYALLFAAFATQGTWESYILAHYPHFISGADDVNNSFRRWLLYISPYFHLLEFVAGCLTCQLYLLVREGGSSARHSAVEPLAWLGVAWIVVAQALLYMTWYFGHSGDFLNFINFLHVTFLMAPGCCLLILSLALGGSSIGRTLGHWAPKYLGEISVSQRPLPWHRSPRQSLAAGVVRGWSEEGPKFMDPGNIAALISRGRGPAADRE